MEMAASAIGTHLYIVHAIMTAPHAMEQAIQTATANPAAPPTTYG